MDPLAGFRHVGAATAALHCARCMQAVPALFCATLAATIRPTGVQPLRYLPIAAGTCIHLGTQLIKGPRYDSQLQSSEWGWLCFKEGQRWFKCNACTGTNRRGTQGYVTPNSVGLCIIAYYSASETARLPNTEAPLLHCAVLSRATGEAATAEQVGFYAAWPLSAVQACAMVCLRPHWLRPAA